MADKIILITGGQRSGKSNYAQSLALKHSANPVYLATSRVWDEEHRLRIEKHKTDRGNEWINIEEEKELSKHNLTGKTILIDCVTLWATNFFFDYQSDVSKALADIKLEFDKFTEQNAHFIFVTNEIGMGEMSQNEIQRKFADLQGWLNQYIVAKANEVYLMVSGIPVKIK
ncbi:bifunctional adenosylcobinamide kinase/adenosylcobinamide-phosphate guanylyltransferase [Dysgonomonas sp. 216]|uniref:bifunctional adenosylcobinamide kinase/adenosylcobinamide-phosphate guanylyltransferase n=1 Tax=Dysgonomonas sp. 216 TaxID=2302934 RepID=UPI0013D4BE0A|nr:bifunctional adenosylcobinamide kinase/adenosylcobinamide-phosphate guanylyltransferase [Dysgonomonas sp. 216]NDW17809.1 bifunctional adenosylcobinamide kinase/adenosylcobinamide-phosphate guanylyltransferase [Dysgonomonas sp. 216]